MHSFYFAAEQAKGIEDPRSRVLITSAKEIKDGAYQLPTDEGLEVPIVDAGEVFSADATASGR
jgi:hypothetical protein